MIEGMTILTQTEIYKKPDWIVNVVIVLAVISILSLIMSISCSSFKLEVSLGVISFICFIALIIFMVIGEKNKFPTGRYEYQVTFDENVSIQEVYDKYEVLNVDEKLWTIKDKE